MKLKPNSPIDYTTQINDTFYGITNQSIREDWGLYELIKLEACLNYKISTDFRTMAESIPYIPMIAIRYNFQKGIAGLIKVSFNLN